MNGISGEAVNQFIDFLLATPALHVEQIRLTVIISTHLLIYTQKLTYKRMQPIASTRFASEPILSLAKNIPDSVVMLQISCVEPVSEEQKIVLDDLLWNNYSLEAIAIQHFRGHSFATYPLVVARNKYLKQQIRFKTVKTIHGYLL